VPALWGCGSGLTKAVVGADVLIFYKKINILLAIMYKGT